MTTPFLPADPEPPQDRDDDPLDDTWWWPGPVEAEHVPDDVILYDVCYVDGFNTYWREACPDQREAEVA